jgi:hypothetical protein
MGVKRIYLDTSVIGGCCDAVFAKWSLALMRNIRIGIFVAVISDLTEHELIGAPPTVRKMLEEIKEGSCERILETSESLTLSEKYLTEGIVTRTFDEDARHIAIATVNEVDILVSWNFRHIVHYDKIQRFNAVNALMGYNELRIFTPMEVASEET